MKQVPDLRRWHGRIDSEEGPNGERWHQHMQCVDTVTEPAIVLLGFACDAGVQRNGGRTGAIDGPAAMRAVLGNIPLLDGIPVVDGGDIRCTWKANDDGLETAQQELAQAVAGLLAKQHRPIVLGGGHEMAVGSFGGLAQHLATGDSVPRIGILNLDTHFNLRSTTRATSGTPFRQIADDCHQRGWDFNYCCLGVSRFANTRSLFERAEALGVHWRLDEQMSAYDADAVRSMLTNYLAQIDHLYFSIGLDVLPADTAPGVSAPAVRGISLDMVEMIIDVVLASGKMRVADIAELNPEYDIDHRTARLAARLVARLAYGWNAA
ncbi:formimidoylglutamase [Actimicrobium sp. CCI2.3]|uniref:formimidoylglutamase n=1 Tax=Actimicrobium sp. CCI2.3 TaxID=3048616 RepID=UPI002AB56428|nr:formimidoylglutamase [Actimicrobium sp. CCI2.3]MDY7573839.1 formimidoylglutamase [Actimicrobium sp. CCI2.3]MEB0023439.1 formimidoylglutamase [Actimicrobium sp. CCI2.3]